MAIAFADDVGWRWEPIHELEPRRKWLFFRRRQKRGVAIYPHEQSEALRLVFDPDGHLHDFVKTQYAPANVHVKVVELLRLIGPEFHLLDEDDEGEYWTTSDFATLQSRIDECAEALAEMQAREPRGRGPVRLPSGRIADFMSEE
jgi:hypothetical protein